MIVILRMEEGRLGYLTLTKGNHLRMKETMLGLLTLKIGNLLAVQQQKVNKHTRNLLIFNSFKTRINSS